MINDIKNGHDKIISLKSIRGNLILQTQNGKLFTMEASSSDQIILYPFISEIKPILNSLLPSIGENSYVRQSIRELSHSLEMRVIRKSVGEQNNEKGSSNLVMIPHRHIGIDGTSS